VAALRNGVAKALLKNNQASNACKRNGRLKIVLVLSFASLLLAGVAAYYAPRLLIYADNPAQSDAVVLFVGPDDMARQKEARRLLNEGYGRFLIVPAYHQVFMRGNIPVPVGVPGTTRSGVDKRYPGFYENTHIEALYAKQIMDAMGLKSAVMVSSAYHMRRISLIAKKVFGEQSRCFSYVPGSTGRNPVAMQELGPADWMFVIQEYVKICWFRLYSPFISKRLNHNIGLNGFSDTSLVKNIRRTIA